MDLIFKTYERYCWIFNWSQIYHFGFPIQNNFRVDTETKQQEAGECNNELKKEIKTRKRRNSALDIEECIQSICRLLDNGTLKFIVGKAKVRPPSYETPKGRGSYYIGVSKNGENWQVLINYGKFKKYIGTFSSEKQAAITYDFYSIWLHLTRAKTNFTYNSEIIREMIQSYNSTSKVFDVERFEDRV